MRAYIEMLPRLQAEEKLTAVTAMALGTGAIDKKDARRIASEWEGQAGIVRKKVRPRPSPEMLAQMGIGFSDG